MVPTITRRSMGWFLAFSIVLAGGQVQSAQAANRARSEADPIRFMTYNVLNYPSAAGDDREDDLRVVLGDIVPDVLVVQEITSGPGAIEFLDDILDSLEENAWACAPFVDGPDTDNACYYRTDGFTYVTSVVLSTDLRDINGYVFRARDHGDAEFRVYSLHLKASEGTTNEARRVQEAQVLRSHLNDLPAGTHVLVAGDFNIYTSEESAWAKLTGSEVDDDGRLYDPINRVGAWHNNAAFADIHTQSTRTTSLPDGGSYGGLDDRFDMILVNDDLLDGGGLDYVEGSYAAHGNDGQHFNAAINAWPANSIVSPVVADALHAASDHLPVYAEVRTVATGVDAVLPVIATARLHPTAPNPFAARTTVIFDVDQRVRVDVEIIDVQGRLVQRLLDAVVDRGEHRVVWSGTSADGRAVASGIYYCRLRSGDMEQTRPMVLVR
ncbi:endonuclease/exonuclease/phosphatase family protein [bacterium]|nr:endonuclease/exonuclease/phosphatase family protein [bacterium]